METRELDFTYPNELIAAEPKADFRILLAGNNPQEISKNALFDLFKAGDILILNDTRVVKRRIYTESGLEILFLRALVGLNLWEVLFPAREIKDSDTINLPGGVTAHLTKRGLPQTIMLSQKLGEDYFTKYADLALPPYIQKIRGERRNTSEDDEWYQTAWATKPGSVAAPTASLHFTYKDLAELEKRGVQLARLTLHIGIGTFLPVKTDNLDHHMMHPEWAMIPQETTTMIQDAKSKRKKIWALGTTAVRAAESWVCGKMSADSAGNFCGETNLFIKPGYKFEVVDCLLTNFHQPKSTLLAMISAFAGIESVRKSYKYAIAEKFRLFSYGDLTVWID